MDWLVDFCALAAAAAAKRQHGRARCTKRTARAKPAGPAPAVRAGVVSARHGRCRSAELPGAAKPAKVCACVSVCAFACEFEWVCVCRCVCALFGSVRSCCVQPKHTQGNAAAVCVCLLAGAGRRPVDRPCSRSQSQTFCFRPGHRRQRQQKQRVKAASLACRSAAF